MGSKFCIYSPVDNSLLHECHNLQHNELTETIENSYKAYINQQGTTLERRVQIVTNFIEQLKVNKNEIALLITKLVGRPIKYSAKEVDTTILRIHSFLSNIEMLREELVLENKTDKLILKHESLGIVFIISPWNYPLLTLINAMVPSYLANNSVMIKSAPQTSLITEKLVKLFSEVCGDRFIIQCCNIENSMVKDVINDTRIQFVQFTGSVKVGYIIKQLCDKRMIRTCFELGGKDAAYVMEDAALEFSAGEVIDGIMFNSGQSCCSIERVYIHSKVYDKFVELVKLEVEKLVLGDPMEQTTTLGPLVDMKQANSVRDYIKRAISEGAIPLIDKDSKLNNVHNYVAPQVLLNCHNRMKFMQEEIFGPVAGLTKVDSDEQAIDLINDSQFGLSCSLWSKNYKRAEQIEQRINTGTVFINRSDYPHPELAWTGTKDSGCGFSLSKYCLRNFTRPKSINLRKI